jgi:preprotein translocase subunit SecY
MAAIIFFCFFYTALQYNPKETADNLHESGAFIPGYRPGDQTAKYVERSRAALTPINALPVIVCFIPNFLIAWKNVPFYFGGTSLLIIVVVTMDFMTQVQAYMMSQQYRACCARPTKGWVADNDEFSFAGENLPHFFPSPCGRGELRERHG